MEEFAKKKELTYRFIADNKVNVQGKVKIYLRFYRNGVKVKDHNIGVRCLKGSFDPRAEIIKEAIKNDSETQMNNLKINHMKSKLHRLDAKSFISGQTIGLQDYLNILEGYSSTDDFVYFSTQNNNYEYNKDIIKYPTWKRHRSSLYRLIEFWGSDIIPINEITTAKIEEFDAYWRRRKRKRNTIAGYHKDIKKQLNEAVEKQLISANPYDKFKFSYVDGDRVALEQEEVRKLLELYHKGTLTDSVQKVLRRFLFSCLTGLRISDTHVVKRGMIINDVLIFTPTKGYEYSKTIKLPLPQTALMLIEDRKDLLFDRMSDKYINELLKIIAGIAGIQKRLTYHCARDTFGTIFMELGGDIKTLKDLMGHSSIKTTEIYLKMSDKRKIHLMNNFDSMFARKE